jgi:hypothetical protein
MIFNDIISVTRKYKIVNPYELHKYSMGGNVDVLVS